MTETQAADLAVEVKSMNDGRNVKCPRCWHWHSVVDNFGHEPGTVLPEGRDADKEKLCDSCQSIILKHFPDHESVPHIRAANAKWFKNSTQPT